MNPGAVLAMVADMGGNLGRVLVVGCEPGELEDGIGLSAPVLAAVPAAVDAVRDLVDSLTKEALP
jgi:hydrogenase maturation protease